MSAADKRRQENESYRKRERDELKDFRETDIKDYMYIKHILSIYLPTYLPYAHPHSSFAVTHILSPPSTGSRASPLGRRGTLIVASWE